jgi:hypothetical protein
MSERPERGRDSERAWPTLPAGVAFVLAIAVIWLGGQFVTQGVADELTDSSPDVAVLARADSADAFSSLARASLLQQHYDGAIRLSARALQLWPLNGPVIATFAIALGHRGRHALADQAMQLGGELGWRDTVTQLWLFRRTVLQRRFPIAMMHADAAMRSQWQVPDVMFEALSDTALDPASIRPMASQLELQPTWRQPFLGYLVNATQPPETDQAYAMMHDLDRSAGPATDDEIALLTNALVLERRYDDAFAQWRALSHPALGRGANVYNADFASDPTKALFDWYLNDGVGWTAHIGENPRGSGRALKVEYDGYSLPQPLGQLLVLKPGLYRVSGQWYDQNGVGAQTMAWKVTCAVSKVQIAKAQLPPGSTGEWHEFSANFAVPQRSQDPASDCPAQRLELWADGANNLSQISVWFDHLAVEPIDENAVELCGWPLRKCSVGAAAN